MEKKLPSNFGAALGFVLIGLGCLVVHYLNLALVAAALCGVLAIVAGLVGIFTLRDKPAAQPVADEPFDEADLAPETSVGVGLHTVADVSTPFAVQGVAQGKVH